ncbi:MAG: aminodeoxychorismate/anthranilate synthase component II, partial [Planctomycetota bacterium]
RYFRRLGCETFVVRNNAIDCNQIEKLAPDAIIISPGPCSPDEAGVSLKLVRSFAGRIPILGICLGHQAIVQAMGGKIERSYQPMHGRRSRVMHEGTPMFQGIGSPFWAGRYHSLVADPGRLPEPLVATAQTESGVIMAVEHLEHVLVGLQFHPESVLTEGGYQILGNFLVQAGIETNFDASRIDEGFMQVSNLRVTSDRLTTRGSR